MADVKDDLRSKLRTLRDNLAAAAPRARSRGAAGELCERLEAAVELVSGAYLLAVRATAGSAAEEMYEDALVEGHLALHDWERWLAQQEQQKLRPRGVLGGAERRQSDRFDTSVAVKLLRHSLRDDGSGGVKLASDATSRPARNVSLGGLFVQLPRQELAEVRVGSVVHVSVNAHELAFQARAAVTRRDDDGVALRWIPDSDRVRRAIDQLLDAVRRARSDRPSR
jgi:hypothetical protein